MNLFEKIEKNFRSELYHEQAKAQANTLKKLLSIDSSDQKDMLLKYRIRETEEQKAQRVRLTNPVTAAAIAPVFSYLEEINRVVGIKREINLPNQNMMSSISAKLSNFYQGKSFEDYFFELSLYSAKYDPNSWLAILPIDNGQEMNFYPLVFHSDQVIDVEKDGKGNTSVFTGEYTELIGEELLKTYYEFRAGSTIVVKEVAKDEQRDFLEWAEVTIRNKKHVLFEYPNTLTAPPVIQLGCYQKDLSGFYEAIITPAFPLVKDLIRDKSWLDTTKALHTFPRRASYVKECEYEGEQGQCVDGYVINENGENAGYCPSCHGTGKMVQTGEQDEIYLVMPQRAEQFVDLAKLTYSEKPDIAHPEFLRAEVDRAKIEIFRAVYNMETIDKTMTVQTATEIRVEYDKIYNKLAPFARLQSKAFSFIWRVCSEYMGVTGAIARKTYPQDYKLKSTNELLVDYQTAISANAPYAVTSEIYKDILYKENKDNPEYVRLMLALEKHRPWRDKKTEEVMVIIQGRSEQDIKRITWENWDDIISEIAETIPGFADANYQTQKRIISNTANNLVSGISYRISTPDNIFLNE